MTVLEARDVCYTYQSKYQRVDAVKAFTASFSKGFVYTLTGKSGSGKSTILSLLGGLDLPSKGNIFFKGSPLSDLDRVTYRRDHVRFIYQNFNLFPALSIIENVSYPLWLQGVGKKEAADIAREALRLVDLDDTYDKRLPRQLSGGEQQRVAIARAIVGGCDVILADEPTGNLDSTNSELVFELLKRLARERDLVVIIATHDLELAEKADVHLTLVDGTLA